MSKKRSRTVKGKKKANEDLGFDSIPQLAVIKELESEIGVSQAFFQQLLNEDDWSFVIKLHSLIEAAVTHLLTLTLDRAELRDLISRLELSNLTTGKLAFVKSLDLLDSESRRFIQKLSELRNKLVHNVSNVGVNLENYFSLLSDEDRKGYYTAFKWGYKDANQVKIKPSDDLYDMHELLKAVAIVTIKYSHKLTIWFGAIIVLRQLHNKVARKKFEKQLSEIDDEMIKLIHKIYSIGEDNAEENIE